MNGLALDLSEFNDVINGDLGYYQLYSRILMLFIDLALSGETIIWLN